ncbi:hypothetical protein JEQ12_005772 [Ovis aries]|uniref:Paternally-expressed gene 3 protein n=1 Tax=Ovis aries TaxID=9940 RepID=A0A836CZQ9_SHEEP|nr:hypothetical protein JEQ12_005772 [Ovis aries]
MLPPKSLSATKPKKSWALNLYELDSDLSEPDSVPGEGATDSEFFHQRFRNFLYVDFIGPRKTLLKLRNLCLDWLQPETRTKEEIIEILVLEQYLAILPERIKPWVCAQKPETCEKLVTLLEQYEEMYEPEDDNSSDTHSEGGMSRRAAESPPPRPALPCCSDRDRDRDWDQDWERDRERGRARERERRRGRSRDMESRDRWPSVRSPRSRFHQRDLALPLAERAKEREHRRRDSLLDLDARSEEAVLYQDMVALTEDRKPQNPIQDNMENYRKLLSLGVQLAEDDGNSHMTQGHSARSKRSAYPSTSRGLKAPETKKSAHRRGICEAESSHGVIMEKFIKDVARSSRSGRVREPSERPHRLSRRAGGDWKEASFSRREAGASERGPEGGAFGGGGFSCSSDPVSKKRALERKRRYHFDVEGQGPVHDPRGGARKRPFESGGEARRGAKAAGASSLSAPPVALSQPLDVAAMPYVCDECGRSFAVISEFVEHQIVHTRESLYEYGESFIHGAAVSEAQGRPAGARRPEGAQAAGNGAGPAEHQRGQAREPVGGSGDEEQDEPFLPSPTFSELQKMYGKDKFYECKVCKETFLHSSALVEHQKIHNHEDREKERSTGAVRRTPMLGELQRACGKEKRYECKVCGETFHHSAALREHQKTHGRGSPADSRARAFEEAFAPGPSLKRRQKTYSREKLYDFREGGDAFGRSSDFMEHQKIHSRKSYFDSRGYEKPLLHSMPMPSSQKSHTITRPPEDEDEEKAFTASSNPEDGQEARAYERSTYERAIFHSLAAFRPPRSLREDGEPSTYFSGLRDPPQKPPAWESPYAGGRHSFFRSSVFYRASRPAPLDHLAGEGPSGWKRDGEASSPSSDGHQHQKARAKKKNIERKNYDASMIPTLRFGEPQTFRPRERFYECPECGEFFVRSSELAEHQKIHNRKKLSGTQTSYAELTSETSYCEQPVLNECKECGECFATVEDLGRHQKIYAREKFHDGKLFGEPVMQDLGLDGSPEEELEEQEEPEEPEDSIYGCKDCGLGFADRADLRDHQKVHGRRCLVDSREYTHPAVHMPPVSEYQKGCLGEQLYECPACGESFVHSSFLFEHQKVHEQDQFYGHRRYEPFTQPLIASPRRPQAPPKSAPAGMGPQCQVCGQEFIHASGLSEHARGHAGEGLPDQGQGGTGAAGPGPAPTEPQQDPGEEPRYECETCGESFPSQADLQEHMRVHEKGEPYDYGAAFVHTSFLAEPPKRDWPFYECKDCGKSFIHSTILTKHQKLHLQEGGAAAAAQEAEAHVLVPREVLRLRGSNVEAAEPEVEAAEPEVEAAEPEVEAAEPLGEAEGPEWEAAEPSGEAEQPHAEAEQPDMDADEPDGAGIEDPEERAEEPEGDDDDDDEPDGAGIEDPEEEGEEQEIQVEEPYYDCGECGETFPSGAAYAEHLTAHASLVILEPAGLYGEGAGNPEGGQPDAELFKCDVCGQLFSDLLSLARHQNSHTG